MPIAKSEYVSDIWREGSFDNRVVFCTGGAGTICSAQVRALVHLGANACIVGRNVQKTESMARDIATARPGSTVIGIGAVDVRIPQNLKDAADRCARELGGIDIVIAGAAGNFLAPITQLSENAFKSVIDIDVLGSYNTVKATLPHLIVAGKAAKATNKPGPRLLFISATIHYVSPPLQVHVAAAKAAVDALSGSCATELGPRGITSNVISPGAILGTEGVERLVRKADLEANIKAGPMQRAGTIRDVADATVWLCSEAAPFINGTVVIVDGGNWKVTTGPGSGIGKYPDFLLADEVVTGVKGMKKAKL